MGRRSRGRCGSMWAPADLFTPAVSAVLFSTRAVASYFYQHLFVLAAVLVVVGAVIGLAGLRKA